MTASWTVWWVLYKTDSCTLIWHSKYLNKPSLLNVAGIQLYSNKLELIFVIRLWSFLYLLEILYSRSQFAIRTREPLYVTSPVGVFLLLLKHLNALPSSVLPASGRCARSARSAQIITLNIFCELTKRYSISPAASVWVSALNLLCDGEIFANFVRNLRKPPTLPIKLNSIYFSKRLWKGSQGVLVGFTKMTFEIRSSFRITFYCLWLLRPLRTVTAECLLDSSFYIQCTYVLRCLLQRVTGRTVDVKSIHFLTSLRSFLEIQINSVWTRRASPLTEPDKY